MKKIKYLMIIALLITFILSSCGFINYVETSNINAESVTELNNKKQEYINKLDESFNESNYYEEERKQFLSLLLETKAQINECDDISNVEKCYINNNELLKGIDKKDYLIEKYTNELNSISNIELYREKEQAIYNKYLSSALESIEKAASKEALEKILTLYKDIIKSIKTDSEYVIEENEAFETYKEDSIVEVNNYINLSNYREEEANNISSIKSETIEDINLSNDYNEIDELIREYKIKVYDFKTDKELYDEELSVLINESTSEINNYINKNDYRNNEVLIIEKLLEKFNNDIINIELKENVILLKDNYKELLDSVKTDKELYNEEKIELINKLIEEIKTMVDYNNLSDNDKSYYDELEEKLLLLSTKEEIMLESNIEKIKIRKDLAISGDSSALVDIKLLYKDNLNYYLDKSLYREEQREEIDNILLNNSNDILLCETYNDVTTKVTEIEILLDNVLTNDEMWEKEDEVFFNTLHSLYGDNILTPPSPINEANDYNELASIIDYYAFYQLDANSFVRDTFRVKMNWNHKDATYEKREVYWYCELIRFAVGFDARIEDDDYIVITLIPYDFGSIIINGTPNKVENMAKYSDDNENSILDRAEEFDSFKYKSNTKSLVCWNSQQLWYALEKDYIPLCVPGSKAEEIFEEAKTILRIIIKEGMSDLQKLFEIYKWCGMNWCHDSVFFSCGGITPNSDDYPDELYSLVSSSHAEGGILYKGVVCSAATKAMLILLKIEGIECIRLLCEWTGIYNQNTINGIQYGTNGSHECLLINLDNKWYYCDPVYSIEFNDTVSYLRTLLPSFYLPWPSKTHHDLTNDKEINISNYEKLCYGEKSVVVKDEEELKSVLDDFIKVGSENQCLSLIYDSSVFDAYDFYIKNYSYSVKKLDYVLSEICIYL